MPQRDILAPLPTLTQPPRLVEVRRATPVLPQIGGVYGATLPDGKRLSVIYRGRLSGVDQLAQVGSQLGDEWAIGPNLWILTSPANSPVVGWIDP